MEKRHFEIRDRAGLEESRLNYDFIDFLKKWGTPILMVVAVVALGYSLYMRREQAKAAQVNVAFRDLRVASGAFAFDRVDVTSPQVDRKGVPLDANPDNLIQIASEYKDVKGLPGLAKLTAADALLRTIRTGMKPGSELSPDGTPANAEDLLTPAQRTANLDQAAALYGDVLAQARTENGSLIPQINAIYGLAAIAESRGKFDDAKAHYEEIIKLVDGTPFKAHVKVAKARLDGLAALAKLPPLFATADLPRIAGLDPEPKPVTPAAPAPGSGVLAPPPDAAPSPAPSPAPAPASAPANTPAPATAPETPPPAPAPK